MKGIYITPTIIKEYNGVSKKILAQIKSIKKYDINMELCSLKVTDKYFKMVISEKNIVLDRVFKHSLYSLNIKKLLNYISVGKFDFVYIRYLREANPFFINFLKKIKKKHNIKIILEIPTYPYDSEDQNLGVLRIIRKSIEIKYRQKLHKYVDKIVTYSLDEKIFNIPCINISNGIDLETIKLIKKNKNESINFISISTCSFWHGIDRFLYSLLQYIRNGGKEKIRFHIVGEGSETPKLKKIVKDNVELQDIVVFHGFKSGEELNEIYNNSDVAIGSLGIHKLKLESVQPLKNREYCAKGLPFVIGFNDPNFKNKEYVYETSYDDELINIEKLIKWYKNLNISPEEIRKDAEKFTWDIQMKKVLDNI